MPTSGLRRWVVLVATPILTTVVAMIIAVSLWAREPPTGLQPPEHPKACSDIAHLGRKIGTGRYIACINDDGYLVQYANGCRYPATRFVCDL